MPVEPVSPSGIAFATNLTPITFNEPDTGAITTGDAPESDLFPSADPSSPRRPAHSKKKADNHIPRPPNAFILFRSSFIKSQHVSTEVETNHSTLSKIIGLTWQNLPEDERQVWHGKAKAALDEHKRKFPQYAFRPLHSKAKGGTEKRKVREVGPKDLKRCAKIAELLVEGKKGQELDAAIQEFDKYHVPEVVTRFEAPITEQTFQRSSNPAVKTEDSEEIFSPSPSIRRSSRSSRSSSVDRFVSHIPSRSASPGPPPPLIDPDEIPQYLLAQSYSPDNQAPSPQAMSGYNLESPFDPSTFSFATTNSSVHEPLLSEESMSSAFSVFDEISSISLSATQSRPSLSVDTSSSYALMEDWTRSSSPANMSIPSTPCYPASPMPGQYSPAYTSYSPAHALRHSSSSLSLESTRSFDSFESTSSYDGLSSTFSSDYHQPFDPSPASSDYHHHNQETPIFIAGSEMSDFLDTYGSTVPISCGSQIDDIFLAKAQAQFQYHSPLQSSIDFPKFISSPLSLGQC
jgi:hypothetical protein